MASRFEEITKWTTTFITRVSWLLSGCHHYQLLPWRMGGWILLRHCDFPLPERAAGWTWDAFDRRSVSCPQNKICGFPYIDFWNLSQKAVSVLTFIPGMDFRALLPISSTDDIKLLQRSRKLKTDSYYQAMSTEAFCDSLLLNTSNLLMQ